MTKKEQTTDLRWRLLNIASSGLTGGTITVYGVKYSGEVAIQKAYYIIDVVRLLERRYGIYEKVRHR